MNINNVNNYASPMQSSYGSRTQENTQGVSTQRNQENGSSGNALQTQDSQTSRSLNTQGVEVNISSEARAAATGELQSSTQVQETSAAVNSSAASDNSQATQDSNRVQENRDTRQMEQQRQSLQQQSNSLQMYSTAPTSPYAASQAGAANRFSVDLIA
ncbi:hypothetical protein MTBBW1_1030018 [Desulfamplus magnetovallimortis]|uniref:Uncharacterized protein n=1 Tax=Desulfamplus magnetovallimortis TaxID=1246637 RepID=A0A1W1H4X9_9BACT|nr:hypothetical protein [Desulfamplus magnetovallimortis]SLM27529.1 hypothetical protein MTBBW1_1030018 [Desulfamplus magnetovallimortis]